MNSPLVILIGFSTTGKSHFLKEIMKGYPNEFSLHDSDKFASALFDCHIYNIYMKLGRKAALEYIKNKEIEFIQCMINQFEKPQLIAAGPALVSRLGWKELVESRNPFIIHLDKSKDSIFEGLSDRRQDQKVKLDTTNANFGSWDCDVLTKFENGEYVDVSRDVALRNIESHLSGLQQDYIKYRTGEESYDSDLLKSDEGKTNELINLIVNQLRRTTVK